MDIIAARTKVNSLFGYYSVDAKAEIKWEKDDETEGAMLDKILRGKDGIQNKIISSDKIVSAVTDPIKFISGKRTDLANIAVKLTTEFQESMLRNMQRNLPLKEVRENVKKDVDEKHDKLMKFHSQDFPEEIVKRIVKKLTGGN